VYYLFEEKTLSMVCMTWLAMFFPLRGGYSWIASFEVIFGADCMISVDDLLFEACLSVDLLCDTCLSVDLRAVSVNKILLVKSSIGLLDRLAAEVDLLDCEKRRQ
jgi:hypothetical protein